MCSAEPVILKFLTHRSFKESLSTNSSDEAKISSLFQHYRWVAGMSTSAVVARQPANIDNTHFSAFWSDACEEKKLIICHITLLNKTSVRFCLVWSWFTCKTSFKWIKRDVPPSHLLQVTMRRSSPVWLLNSVRTRPWDRLRWPFFKPHLPTVAGISWTTSQRRLWSLASMACTQNLTFVHVLR